jgi:hypothetical protein
MSTNFKKVVNLFVNAYLFHLLSFNHFFDNDSPLDDAELFRVSMFLASAVVIVVVVVVTLVVVHEASARPGDNVINIYFVVTYKEVK